MARTELVEKRTRAAKHYREDDGTYTAEISGARHFFDEAAQEWRDEDQTLVPDGADGHAAPDSEVPAALTQRGANWFLTTSLRRNGMGIEYQLPGTPIVEGNLVRFTFAGVEFRYYNRAGGLKLEGTFAAHRGPRTYSFNANVVGGARALEVNADGALESDEFTIPPAYARDADGVRREASAWRIGPGNTISFDFDDTGLALPYVLDPTTNFDIAASADDAYIGASAASYPPASGSTASDTYAGIYLDRSFSAGNYNVYVDVIKFGTSSLPDEATITAATLQLQPTVWTGNANSRSVTAEWYSWTTLAFADWTATAGTDAHAGTSLASISVGTQANLALTNVNNINKTGTTGMRLHISGGQPTGTNQLEFASFDHASIAQPRLVVDYTTGWSTRTAPDAILGMKGLTGTLADIDEDPDTGDASWLVVG